MLKLTFAIAKLQRIVAQILVLRSAKRTQMFVAVLMRLIILLFISLKLL